MSTIVSLPLAPSSVAPVVAPASTVPLADLLAEVGTALEPLAVEALAPRPLATLTAHLVDSAGLSFLPDPAAPAIVSLRALGVLASRTASTAVTLPAPRATRIRSLLTTLTAA